jgi:hypothetical protein
MALEVFMMDLFPPWLPPISLPGLFVGWGRSRLVTIAWLWCDCDLGEPLSTIDVSAEGWLGRFIDDGEPFSGETGDTGCGGGTLTGAGFGGGLLNGEFGAGGL